MRRCFHHVMLRVADDEDEEDEDYDAMGRMTVKVRSEALVQVMRESQARAEREGQKAEGKKHVQPN